MHGRVVMNTPAIAARKLAGMADAARQLRREARGSGQQRPSAIEDAS